MIPKFSCKVKGKESIKGNIKRRESYKQYAHLKSKKIEHRRKLKVLKIKLFYWYLNER